MGSLYSASPPDSGSFIGVEMTYPLLAHLPRSITRQRSLQKGKSASVGSTILRHVGQRRVFVFFRGISLRMLSQSLRLRVHKAKCL